MKRIINKHLALIALLAIGSSAHALVFTILNDTDKTLNVKAHGYHPVLPGRPNFTSRNLGKKFLTFGPEQEVKINNWRTYCLRDIEVAEPGKGFHEAEIMGIPTADSKKIDAAVAQLAQALKEWNLNIGDDINLIKKQVKEEAKTDDKTAQATNGDNDDTGNDTKANADEKKFTLGEVMKIINESTSLVGTIIESSRTLRQYSRCKSNKFELKLLPDADSKTGWKWYATYLVR